MSALKSENLISAKVLTTSPGNSMYHHRRSHKSQRCPCSVSVLENIGFGPLVKAEKRSHQCRGLVSYRPIKSEYNSVTIKYKGGGGKNPFSTSSTESDLQAKNEFKN